MQVSSMRAHAAEAEASGPINCIVSFSILLQARQTFLNNSKDMKSTKYFDLYIITAPAHPPPFHVEVYLAMIGLESASSIKSPTYRHSFNVVLLRDAASRQKALLTV